MKTNGRFWILAVASGIVATGLNAATYFVDQKHPQAADTNAGTAEQPWKTVGHATRTMKAGDTARIKAGRYREGSIVFGNSGEPVAIPNVMLVEQA